MVETTKTPGQIYPTGSAVAKADIIQFETQIKAGIEALAQWGDTLSLTNVTGTGDAVIAEKRPQQAELTAGSETLLTVQWPATNTTDAPTLTISGTTLTVRRFGGVAVEPGELIGSRRYLMMRVGATLRLIGSPGISDVFGLSPALQGILDQLDAQGEDFTLHVANAANPHGVTKVQIGLANADNTADVDKPVSTAQQAALDLKFDYPLAWRTRQSATYTAGAYISKDSGELIVNAQFEYAIIDIPTDVVEITVTGALDSDAWALVVYYDESDTYLGYEYAGPGTYELVEGYGLTIPEGAAKLGLSKRILHAAYPDHTIQFREKQGDTPVTVDMEDALSEWVELPPASYTSGYYISASDGAIVENATFEYSFIEIPLTTRDAQITGWVENTTYALVTYFDAAGQYLGYERLGLYGAELVENYELAIPAGAAQIGITKRTFRPDHIVTLKYVAAPRSPITIWGDSTADQTTNGIGDEIEALFPDRRVYHQAIGGQGWASRIKYRLGLANATVTLTGGAIPASGAAVEATPSIGLLQHLSSDVVIQVMINGVRCALRFIRSTGSYTIEALDDLASDVAVGAGTPMRVLTGFVLGASADAETCVPLAALLSGVQIVRSIPSINDRHAIDYADFSDMVDDAMAAYSKYSDKLIFVGMMNGEKDLPTTYPEGTEATEADSYETLAFVRWANEYMRSKLPNFVDVQQLHIDNDGSEEVTVSGVQFAVLTSTATIPKLSDGRHETETAQDETAALIADVIAKANY